MTENTKQDSSNLIHNVKVQAAEEAVIAGIPADLMEVMRKADEEFKARGGCKGCGSQILAIHYGSCPELKNDLF